MKFMSILNAFNINDHKTLSNKQDEIYLYVYSDVIGSLFKCGTYSFQSGDFLDLNMLEVPCDEHVIVTLMEKDFKFNDGHTIMIPCKPNAQMTFDFIIPSANDFRRIVDTTS